MDTRTLHCPSEESNLDSLLYSKKTIFEGLTFVHTYFVTLVSFDSAFIDIKTCSPVTIDIFVSMVAFASEATRIIVTRGIKVAIMNSFSTLVKVAAFFRRQFRCFENIDVNITGMAITFI